MNTMSCRFCSKKSFLQAVTLVALISALAVCAGAQNVLATVSIPAASAGQVAVNPALNKIYAGGGPNAGGSSLTIIDGSTFTVLKTVSALGGVSVDMKQDNYFTGTLSTAKIDVFAGKDDSSVGSVTVTACPAFVSYDCTHRTMWVSSSCGSGNDPVWPVNADTLALLNPGVVPSGTISQAGIVSPTTGKLYVTAGGVSKEIDPSTFAVSNTPFGGTVMAIDSFAGRLFALNGKTVQYILAKGETIKKTFNLSYTAGGMAFNNAMSHLYITNPAGNSIDVYSTAGKILTTFSLGANNQPTSIAADSARGRLFVDVLNTSSNSWSLYVIEDLSSVRHCGFSGSCDY